MNKRNLLLGFVLMLFASPVWANWSVVQQSASPQVQASTISVQFPTNVTAGNTLLVHVIWATTASATVSDTLGNTFSSAALAQGSTSQFQISSQLFYVANAKGGPDVVTVTLPSATFLNFFLYEVAGVDPNNPLDVIATGNGLGASVVTSSATTSAANDFVFVGTAHHYGADSTGAGFIGLQQTPTGLSEYEIAAFPGASVSGSSYISGINPTFPWAAVLAAFRASPTTSSGGGPTLTSIQVTPGSPTISFGGALQFSATGYYSDGSVQNLTNSATWASSNSAVATISASGLASAAGHGTTTITASVGTVSGSTPLTVLGSLISLQVTPASPTLLVGSNQQFTATGGFNDGSAENLTGLVSWTSSNTSVATISSSGLSTAVGAGTTTITATSGSITGTATMAVNQPVTVAPAPSSGTPLAQSNFSWSTPYFMQVPPTAGGTSCTPAPCIAQTFLNPNAAGNTILVWVSWNVGGFNLTSLSDSAGNTYVHVAGFPVSGSLTDDFWVAYNVKATSNNKITATFGSGTAEPTYIQMLEYSGLATSNALDVYSTTRKQIQCIAPCTMSTTPTPTTTQAAELLVAIFDVGRGLITTGTNWTPDADCFSCLGWETDVTGNVLIEHQLVNSTGSFTATITNSTAGWPAYDAYLFTFKLHP